MVHRQFADHLDILVAERVVNAGYRLWIWTMDYHLGLWMDRHCHPNESMYHPSHVATGRPVGQDQGRAVASFALP